MDLRRGSNLPREGRRTHNIPEGRRLGPEVLPSILPGKRLGSQEGGWKESFVGQMAVEPLSKWEDVSHKTRVSGRMWGTWRSSRTAESRCLGTHMGRDPIRGMVPSRKGFRFLPGDQWEPRRDLSRGCCCQPCLRRLYLL